MKIQQYMATMVLMFGFTVSSYGQCLVQETTVFYVNGVDSSEQDSKDARKKIETDLFANQSINPECVLVKYAYNISQSRSVDLIEAAVQKTNELHLGMSDFWKLFLRVAAITSGNSWFNTLVDDFYVALNDIQYVIDSQLQNHLNAYRNELNQERQVILVSHSQGNFYANDAWNELTTNEQSQVHIVAVATPSDRVADDGNHTTVEEDGVLKQLIAFTGALPANAANEEVCPGGWYCHEFLKWYMTGHNSHDQIIDDIVALLPTEPTIDPCAVEGVIEDVDFHITPYGRIVLASNIEPYTQIAEYPADAVGNYCIPHTDVSDGNYRIYAYVGNQLIETAIVTVSSDSTWFANFPTPVLE